jgi:hypothetical protein
MVTKPGPVVLEKIFKAYKTHIKSFLYCGPSPPTGAMLLTSFLFILYHISALLAQLFQRF